MTAGGILVGLLDDFSAKQLPKVDGLLLDNFSLSPHTLVICHNLLTSSKSL